MDTSAFGGGGVSVWGLSLNCRLDLHVLQGNLSDVTYRDNALSSHVDPHFDNHPLVNRSMFMDDNPSPHMAHITR